LRDLGRLISAARRARRLTQTELAERAGTSRPTINRLESGSAKVAWGTVATVCWLLDLPTDPELMDPGERAVLLAGAATFGGRVQNRRWIMIFKPGHRDAFVWLWLPGEHEPVVCGRISASKRCDTVKSPS
jgi:transcriptional regulator with XRE-family HTH domain